MSNGLFFKHDKNSYFKLYDCNTVFILEILFNEFK